MMNYMLSMHIFAILQEIGRRTAVQSSEHYRGRQWYFYCGIWSPRTSRLVFGFLFLDIAVWTLTGHLVMGTVPYPMSRDVRAS
jgi:hypothetical protein